MYPNPDAQLLTLFKALADANRLKIIGLLSQQEYSVEQLAAILHLQPSTVSHHLSRLAKAGLVSARADSYYNLYSLQKGALEDLARQLLSLPDQAFNDVDADAYDRKVLHNYLLPGGRLKTIPAQRKKLEVVLKFIAESFASGKRYAEREVNQVLGHFHEDTARLRREMVGYRLLGRERGEYWRIEPAPENLPNEEVSHGATDRK